MEYLAYSDILEYIPYECKNINEIRSNQLYLYIKKFLETNNISKILLSLSGGVDSMVLFVILKEITNEISNFKFYCCHINYNNRNESKHERDFLISWCETNNIQLEVSNIEHIKRGDINRQKYEEESKNIRYTFYKNTIEKYCLDGVLLAHHKDYYSENVFNNIMRGKNNITNLGVFKEINKIFDVNVFRPMLEFRKDVIYKLSSDFQIPYFLDTTPEWSCRGKMRNNIFPECEECYTSNFMKNLFDLGKQSESVNRVFYKHLINPIMESIYYGEIGFLIPKNECMKEMIIFESVIKNVCSELNIGNVKKVNIQNAIDNFNTNKDVYLLSGYKSFITSNYIVFFDDQEINNIKSKKTEIKFNLIDNVQGNIFEDLVNGIFYYKYDKIPNNVTFEGKDKNFKLNKMQITEKISKYIPNIYADVNNYSKNDNKYFFILRII